MLTYVYEVLFVKKSFYSILTQINAISTHRLQFDQSRYNLTNCTAICQIVLQYGKSTAICTNCTVIYFALFKAARVDLLIVLPICHYTVSNHVG